MIERQVNAYLSPEELADEFCGMSSDKQALFFNRLHENIEQWAKPFAIQLQYITDDKKLTDGARYIMRQIGEYSEKQ